MFIGICLIFSLSIGASAQPSHNGDKEKESAVEECSVKNFGKVSDHLFRGGQPKGAEYEQLAHIGIRTVIDLREDAEEYARARAQEAGMKYINLRLSSKRPPTEEESNLFLRFVNDEANWPVFVHCAAGKHRTGVLVAVYRMEIERWNADRAYREMKDYDFYTRFGHGKMKSFVFDYYRNKLERRPALEPITSSARGRRVVEGVQ